MNWLILGYGSDLRRDDAVGPLVALRLDRENLPGVQILTPHQLGPELAANLCEVDRCLFLDAYPAETGDGLRLEQLPPPDGKTLVPSGPLRHSASPLELRDLCVHLYGKAPACWVLGIPAFDLELGEGLSEATTQKAAQAFQVALDLLSTRDPLPG